MSSKSNAGTRLALVGCVAAAVAWFVSGGSIPSSAGQTTKAPAVDTQKTPADRPEDRVAVNKAIKDFTAAFQKGDAKAVAGSWTEAGEYTSEDGEVFQGRAALEKAYADFFAMSPGNALEVEVASIRFPSRDTAVVEGHFKLRRAKGGELVVSRCSFLFTREEGNWLIAIAREWPGDGLTVRDLEWLIGTWQSKQEGHTVTTTYEWTKDKTFIRCQFSIERDGNTLTGMQIIGKMPSTGGLHSWTFEDAGGIGDADITHEGKKWYFMARGSTTEGQVVTATNIMTQIDADRFLWQSVERTLDEEEMPDLPPIKVVRVKGQ